MRLYHIVDAEITVEPQTAIVPIRIEELIFRGARIAEHHLAGATFHQYIPIKLFNRYALVTHANRAINENQMIIHKTMNLNDGFPEYIGRVKTIQQLHLKEPRIYC